MGIKSLYESYLRWKEKREYKQMIKGIGREIRRYSDIIDGEEEMLRIIKESKHPEIVEWGTKSCVDMIGRANSLRQELRLDRSRLVAEMLEAGL